MSKELEALERLKTAPTFMGGTVQYQFCTKSETLLLQDYDIVKQALLELESIKKAELSEALKTLDVLDKTISPLLEPVLAEYEDDLSDKITSNYFVLRQSLLNAREQEKENELLKEIIKSFFDRGCPLHQYTDKEGILQIEVDDECSTMHLGKFKGVDLDKKLKEVLE